MPCAHDEPISPRDKRTNDDIHVQLAVHRKRLEPHNAALTNSPTGRAFLGVFNWSLRTTSDLTPDAIDDLSRDLVILDVCDSWLTPFERSMKQKVQAARAEGLA